jgi:hypothetical protein
MHAHLVKVVYYRCALRMDYNGLLSMGNQRLILHARSSWIVNSSTNYSADSYQARVVYPFYI